MSSPRESFPLIRLRRSSSAGEQGATLPLTANEGSNAVDHAHAHAASHRRWMGLPERWSRKEKSLIPQLNRSQIEWISIGNIIGQGLFLGTAGSLRTAGPAGMLIAYIITSSVMFFMLHATAELVTFRPNVGGIVGLPDTYVDKALGFAMGWNAWYNWTFIIPAQISAAALLITSFAPDEWSSSQINAMNLGFTAFFAIVALLCHAYGMYVYARIEKYLAIFKVWAGIFLILTCILVASVPVPTSHATPFLHNLAPPLQQRCGALFGLNSTTLDKVLTAQNNSAQVTEIEKWMPNAKVVIGFKYWQCPGAFVQYRGITEAGGRFAGVWEVLLQASFSFIGTEVIAMAPAELKNPRKILIPATLTVWSEISVLYIFAVFAVGLVVPSNHTPLGPFKRGSGRELASSSPFITALTTAQVKYLPRIIAIVFVMSAWSAAISGIYLSSRLLFLLSERGHAPGIFRICYHRPAPEFPSEHWAEWRKQPVFIPWVGVLVAGAISTLALWSTSSADAAFQWFTRMTTCAAILHWVATLVTYIRWYRGTQHARKNTPGFEQDANIQRHLLQHRHWYQPWGAYYAIAMCILILVFNGWSVFTREGGWIFAEEPGIMPPKDDPEFGHVLTKFITSYLPLPLFLLAIFGYKLVTQSQTVPIKEMDLNCVAVGEDAEDGDLHWTERVVWIWGKWIAPSKLWLFCVRTFHHCRRIM